jgi:hypothetical protein
MAREVKFDHLRHDRHLISICYAHFCGETIDAIAKSFGCNWNIVKKILATETAQQLLEAFKQNSIDTLQQVQSIAQALAPEAIWKIAEHMRGPAARESLTAAIKLTEISGHKPVNRVLHERPHAVDEKYRDKTPEDIRKENLALFDKKPGDPATATPTATESEKLTMH